jgi:phenylacetate-CoA ligase
LIFYRNQDWDAWHNASVIRGLSWHNVNPWERNGYLWGHSYAFMRQLKTKILDHLQNRFRLFSYDEKEMGIFVQHLQKAVYLSGYSSMIYEIAKFINEKCHPKPSIDLKLVKGTSETIHPSYYKDIESAFGRRIVSEYGAAEAGIIAFECREGQMHINMETVIAEVDNGEIILTNLVSRSFPIIRYKLGDYVEKAEPTQCKCGLQHLSLRSIVGRVGKLVHGYTQKYPSLTLYYICKNLALEHGLMINYQAIQTEIGKLTLQVENKLDPAQHELLKKQIFVYYNNDLNVEVIDGCDLCSKTKKKMDFISHL